MATFLQNKTLSCDETFIDSKMQNLYDFSWVWYIFGLFNILFHIIVREYLFLNSNHGTFQLTRLDRLLLIKHESLHVTFVLDACIK